MLDFKECPVCHEAECFGCEDDHCKVLKSNNFGDRKCPFFKTREQVEKENACREERLASIEIEEE